MQDLRPSVLWQNPFAGTSNRYVYRRMRPGIPSAMPLGCQHHQPNDPRRLLR